MVLPSSTQRYRTPIRTRIRRRRCQSLRQRNRPETRVKSAASCARRRIRRGLEDRRCACGRRRPVLSVIGDSESAATAAATSRHELDARPADDRAIILRIHGDTADLRRECGGAVGVGDEGGRGGGVGDDGGVEGEGGCGARRPARESTASRPRYPRRHLRHYLRILPHRAIDRDRQRRTAPRLRPTARNPHLRAPEPRRTRAVFFKQSSAGIRHPASEDAHPSVRVGRRSRRGCRHRIIPCAYRDDLLRRFIAQYFIHFCHHLGRIRDGAPCNPAVGGGGKGGGCGGEVGGDRRSTSPCNAHDACGGVHQPAITPQQERHLPRRQRPPTIRHNRIHIFNRHATRHHRAYCPRRRIRYRDPTLRLVVIETPEVQNRRIRQDGINGRLCRRRYRRVIRIRRQDGQPILAVVGVEEVARHRRRIIRRNPGSAWLAVACIARARQPH